LHRQRSDDGRRGFGLYVRLLFGAAGKESVEESSGEPGIAKKRVRQNLAEEGDVGPNSRKSVF
jgi:hypothetical protein